MNLNKLKYKLNVYIKAVRILAIRKGFDRVEVTNTGGSAVHFDLFEHNAKVPCQMWQVHTGHTKQKFVTSKDDFRKPPDRMNSDMDTFLKILEDEK